MSKYGVLLAVSSLPGPHGIGDFGNEAYQFVRWLKKHNYSYWQILPLNPLGPGHSPYMSSCSEAIDSRYISLDILSKQGLISKVKRTPKSARVNYQDVNTFKANFLKEAFKKDYQKNVDKLKEFEQKHEWVRSYAIFSVLKQSYNNTPWNTWNDDDIHYDIQKGFPLGKEEECLFYEWCQMVAYEQWNALRKYAKENGIKIIADCPFYVGLESVDCWLYKDEFFLDNEYHPTLVSGCPPDAFSDDGQLWGTPIYNFEKMSENHYQFLVNRIGNLAKMCDILRLDHFRAFDTYCVIPAGDKNARRGEWKVGPKNEFFDELYRQFSDISLIAEDLGELFPSVHELRDFYKLPGMYVSEFMVFDEHNQSNENQIVYPGTHDNNTVHGWIESLNVNDFKYLNEKFGQPHNLAKAFLKCVWNQPSKLTIIQMQDLLGLGSEARMNFPGTMGSPNWEWKLKSMCQLCWPKYKRIK